MQSFFENNKPSLLNIAVLFSFLLFFAGCAKVSHLQELLTLKSLSEDRDQQEVRVARQQRHYDKLIKTVSSNSLKRELNQKTLVEEFGEPITVRTVSENEKQFLVWVYKDPEQNFNSPKVYFYLDPSGNCQRWEYFPRKGSAQNESEMEQALLEDSSS